MSISNEPTAQEIHGRLCAIASERLQLPPGSFVNLDRGTSLVEELQLDSLAQVTLLAAIEDEFGVILEPGGRDEVVTLDDLVAAIQSQLAADSGTASQNG